MKLWIAVAVMAFSLTGCAKRHEDIVGSGAAPPGRGRFVGVGIYSPSRLWPQLAAEPATKGDDQRPANPGAATLADDSQIIVVLDSNTGQLRQCGNLSGVCIGMNSWSKALTAERTSPAQLVKHELDLEREEADAATAAGAQSRQTK